MARLNLFRFWLFRRFVRRPLVKQPDRPARIRLERLEERLPPGDLFNLTQPGWTDLLDPLSSTTRPEARPSLVNAVTTPVTAPVSSPVSSYSPPAPTSSSSAPAPVVSSTPTSSPLFVGPGLPDGGASNSNPMMRLGPTVFSSFNASGAGAPAGASGGPTAPGTNSQPSTRSSPFVSGPPVTNRPNRPPNTNRPPVVTPPPTTRPPTNPPTVRPPSTPQPSLFQITAIRDRLGNNVMGQATNETLPTVVGTGPANRSVTVYADGRAVGNATVNAQGTWSLRLTTRLADGWHTFTAGATGSAMPGDTQATLLVDTRAPSVQLDAAEFVGHNESAWVQVTVQDSGSGHVPHYTYDVDLNGDGQFSGREVGYYTTPNMRDALPNLPEGTYDIQARVRDRAGNEGRSAVVRMQVDPNAGILGSHILRELAGMGNSLLPPRDPSTPPSFEVGNPGQYLDNIYTQDDRVLIQVRSTLKKNIGDLGGALNSMGFDVTHTTVSSNMITGWLPIRHLGMLEAIPSFSSAVPVFLPRLKPGSVQSEGDAVMKADVFRQQFGLDGSGFKVGVISDSTDQVGNGLADSVASGDLPSNVQVLQDGGTNDTDEGRAMLEIVYDVAPGAPLAFHTGGGGPTVFANAIRALAAAGSKVIVDDLGYANSPHFTPGRMGMAVDDVVRQGAVYVTAGGNDGDYAWKGVWRGRSATVDGIAGTYMDFNGSALQTFTLAANETVTMKFAWDATFLEGGDPAARFQVPNDLVVYIVDVGANNILATFDDINPTTDEAFEFIDYTNTSGATNLAYAFRLKSGAAPARISWIDFGSSVDIQAQGQGATTLYGQVLAASALTIAAADAATPTVPEPFTALGGQLEIFSDDQGNRFAAPVLRQKPEVTGPDGVHTSFFGQDDGQGGFQFFGTSAAAPHVAAAAALLLQQQPTAKHVDIVQHMQNTAMDIGAPGVDALTGYGMVQVQQFKLSGPGSDDSSGALEPNEDSSRSFHLGTIGAFAQTVSGLAIGTTPLGLPDYDWFTFNAANAGRVNVTMNNSNLEMHLFLENGGFLTEIGNGTLVPAGRKIYIEVKGRSIAPGRLSQGAYQLTISVA